jgi:hypothetical protein
MSHLRDHPNRPFVDSLRVALTEGFWPWAKFSVAKYLTTHDLSVPMPDEVRFAKFLRENRDRELEAGRFSPAFGNKLLPGMYAMPVHVIEQHEKFRAINNHSAGVYSLNSMIPVHERSVRLDGIRPLARIIIDLRKRLGDDAPIHVWKADVKGAFRNCPMHPYAQAWQATRVDNQFHIDRTMVFGNAASPRIWCTLYAASHGVENVLTYVDDNFSAEAADQLEFYAPFQAHLPTTQVQLLKLWSDLGIPFEKSKQQFGKVLTVIGFEVDTTSMIISMPLQARSDLCDAILDFVQTDRMEKRSSWRRKLKEFQQLAGWINWALNVYPHLRPALARLYQKMAENPNPNKRIRVNEPLVRDLLWIRQRIRQSSGVFLMDSIAWDEPDADTVIYTDASLSGLGFWCAMGNEAYYADLPWPVPEKTIFFYEAFVVLCAIRYAIALPSKPKRLLIFSNNFNTVNMFASFSAKVAYYEILMEVSNLIRDSGTDLRVEHISGSDNLIADFLSRKNFDEVRKMFPFLPMHDFQPVPPRRAEDQ